MFALSKTRRIRVCSWDKPQKCLVLSTRKVLLLEREKLRVYEEGVTSSGVGRSAAGVLYVAKKLWEGGSHIWLFLWEMPSVLDQIHIPELL